MKHLKVIITTMILVTALIASAQPPQGQGRQKNTNCTQQKNLGQRHDQMGDMLNLSDIQKEKIKSLRLEHNKRMLPIRNEIGEKKARLQTLTTTEPIDKKAIDALVAEIGTLRTKIAKEKINHRLDVRAELTEEQKIIFDTHNPMNKKRNRNGYGKL